MLAKDMITDMEASLIVATKKVVLCNAVDKKTIEEKALEEELNSLFLIECEHCKPNMFYVITETQLARGLVTNELLKQRESEVGTSGYDTK